MSDREINIQLFRERERVERIEREAKRDGATVESILKAIEWEMSKIDRMLYQID